MSSLNMKDFEKEKLVIGIMYKDIRDYNDTLPLLTERFGIIDTESTEYRFSDYSSFYDQEMNGSVNRKFVSFKRLVDPAAISQIKIWTNSIEDATKNQHGRTINIDPCLLCHGRFIMSTTKEASYRIPLNNKIYAELSLVYSRGAWHEFFWTYRDIKSNTVKEYLEIVRELFLSERNVKDQL